MANRLRAPGNILIEAEVCGPTGHDIRVGSTLPVQFVSESGTALPSVEGKVVSRTRREGNGEGTVRIEIRLWLCDLAGAFGR